MSVNPISSPSCSNFLYRNNPETPNHTITDQKLSNPLNSLDLIEEFCRKTFPERSTLSILSEAVQDLKTLNLRKKNIKITEIDPLKRAIADLALVVAYTNDATQHGSPKFLEPLFLSMDPEQATIEREKVKQQFLTMNQENDKRKYEAHLTLLTFVDFFQSVMINRGANRTFYPLKSNVTFPKGSPWNGASSYALNGKGDSGAIRLFAMDHNGTIILVEDRHMMYHEKDYYTTLPYSFQGKEYVIPMSSYPEKINFPEGNGVSISYETIESYLSRNKHKLKPKEIEKFYEKYGEKGVIGSISEVTNFCLSDTPQIFSKNEADHIWKFTSNMDMSDRNMWFSIAAQRIAARREKQLHQSSKHLATAMDFYIPTSQLYSEWKEIANEIDIPMPESVRAALNALLDPKIDLDESTHIPTAPSENKGKKGKKSLAKGHNPSVLTPSANQLDQTKVPTTSLQSSPAPLNVLLDPKVDLNESTHIPTTASENKGKRKKKFLPKGHNPSVLTPSANQLDQTKVPTTSLQDPLRECDKDLHAISLRATLNKTKNYNLRIKGSHIQVTIPGHGTRTMPRSSTGKKRKAYEQIIVDWLVEVSQQ